MSGKENEPLDHHRLVLFIEQIRELSTSINAEINFLPFLNDILSSAATYLNAEASIIAIRDNDELHYASFGLNSETDKAFETLMRTRGKIKQRDIAGNLNEITDVIIKDLNVDGQSAGQCVFINKETREGIDFFNDFDHSLIEILSQQIEIATNKLRKHNDQQALLALNRSVLNASSGAIVAIDSTGNILTYNNKASEWFDIKNSSYAGSLFAKMPASSPVLRFIRESLEGDQMKMADSLPLSASSDKIMRVYVAPFPDPGKNRNPWIISFEDETELKKVKETFTKYVSKDVLKYALSANHGVRLGGERKDCAIFFSDIRGFTSFSEKKDPEDVVETLNQYFNAMIQPINNHGGAVDKLVGDEIMAVFHHEPAEVDHPVKRAVNTALDMRESLELFNSLRSEQNLEKLYFGIGIHYGDVICGNIGSFDRMDYTLIGDNVNTAARFCSFARRDEIIISEQIYEMVRDDFVCDLLKPIEVKGKTGSLKVYSVSARK